MSGNFNKPNNIGAFLLQKIVIEHGLHLGLLGLAEHTGLAQIKKQT